MSWPTFVTVNILNPTGVN